MRKTKSAFKILCPCDVTFTEELNDRKSTDKNFVCQVFVDLNSSRRKLNRTRKIELWFFLVLWQFNSKRFQYSTNPWKSIERKNNESSIIDFFYFYRFEFLLTNMNSNSKENLSFPVKLWNSKYGIKYSSLRLKNNQLTKNQSWRIPRPWSLMKDIHFRTVFSLKKYDRVQIVLFFREKIKSKVTLESNRSTLRSSMETRLISENRIAPRDRTRKKINSFYIIENDFGEKRTRISSNSHFSFVKIESQMNLQWLKIEEKENIDLVWRTICVIREQRRVQFNNRR